MTVTFKHSPTQADRRRKAIANELADKAFAAFVATLPADPATRRWACERMTRLTGAQVAIDHGEGALHCALNGAVVAAAPAHRPVRRSEVEAVFAKGEG